MERRLFAWLAVPLLACVGCGQILERLLEDDYEELPVKNEAGVLAIGRSLAKRSRRRTIRPPISC